MNGIHVLEAVVGLVAVVVAVPRWRAGSGCWRRSCWSWSGLALSFVPGFPIPQLDPEFVSSACCRRCSTWPRWRPRCRRSGTTCGRSCCSRSGWCCSPRLAVGLVVHALLPPVPLAACLALGAVVAPPDAVAATAVARRIGLPRRMVTILEGESLLNDATALVLFRVAVGGRGRHGGRPVGDRRPGLVAAGGGVLVGAVGRGRVRYLHQRTTDPLMDNALSLLTPFVVAVAGRADARLRRGGGRGHRALPRAPAADADVGRRPGCRWARSGSIVKFLLEGIVFLLVGLQLRTIVADLHDTGRPGGRDDRGRARPTVIVGPVRLGLPGTYLVRLVPRVRRREPAAAVAVPAVIGWAGMRGVVTLATALALPPRWPTGRRIRGTLFVWLAFAVIVGHTRAAGHDAAVGGALG